MDQMHKRFADEQIRLLYQRYCEGTMSRTENENIFGVGKVRCFLGWKVVWERTQQAIQEVVDESLPRPNIIKAMLWMPMIASGITGADMKSRWICPA